MRLRTLLKAAGAVAAGGAALGLAGRLRHERATDAILGPRPRDEHRADHRDGAAW